MTGSLVVHAAVLVALATWVGSSRPEPAPVVAGLFLAEAPSPTEEAPAPVERLPDVPPPILETDLVDVLDALPPEPEPPSVEPLPEPDAELEPLDPVEADRPVPLVDAPLLRSLTRPRPPPPDVSARPPAPAPPPARPSAPATPVSLPRGPVRPAYAPAAPPHPAMRALNGRVTTVLLLHVDGEGRVEEAHVERSSGLASLDEHARQWALSRWRYPALGTRFRTRVPFHFDP